MNFETLPGISQFSLKGRSAVVTGGSRGLGYVIAAGLASAGANLLLVGRNENDARNAAQALSEKYNVAVSYFLADITDEAQANAMAAHAAERFGGIDILVNSAGINIRGPINELSVEDFTQVMDVNVKGTWLSCRAVIPYMKKAQYGRIINIGSALGLIGLAGRTPYTASKGAVIQMTRTLALELAADNILVNVICPGPFLTEMNIPIADTEATRRDILDATALKRWGKLKEIQGPAILLSSEAAGYMTGSVLSVDGGWTAG